MIIAAASSIAERSSEVSTGVASRPATTRSRVTNGNRLLEGIDGRSAEARRYKDLAMSFADDMGGASALTEAQRTLVRQAAWLTMQSEKLQTAMLRGEPIDDEQATRIANSLSRTLHRLGLKRASKPVPSLADRLRAAERNVAT